MSRRYWWDVTGRVREKYSYLMLVEDIPFCFKYVIKMKLNMYTV